MVSSFSPNLKIEEPAQGDYAGGWANLANKNYNLLDNAISAITSVDITGTGDVTLTSLNGTPDQARNAILVLKGTPSTQLSVLLPNSLTKLYGVRSKVTNSQIVVINNAAKTGAGCTIAPMENFSMFTDGVRCNKLGVVPKGTVMFWTGTVSNVPPGWAYNGFIAGYIKGGSTVVGSAAVNPTGVITSAGSHAHTGLTAATSLTNAQIPGHVHTYQRNDTTQLVQSGTGDIVVGVGTSTYNTGITGGSDGHTHGISSDGKHTHTISITGGTPVTFQLIPIQKIT